LEEDEKSGKKNDGKNKSEEKENSPPKSTKRWPALTLSGVDCMKCIKLGSGSFCHHHR